jgi:hypothetical protein
VRAAETLPPRWRQPDTIDLRATPPRPFDGAFDAQWVPWLRQAEPTGVRFLRKSMWEIELSPTAAVSSSATAAVFGAAKGAAFGVFRPQWGWRERDARHRREGACEAAAAGSEEGSKALRTEAARELMAFGLERLLGLYRAPPIVWRCFDMEAELGAALAGSALNDEKPAPRTARAALVADAALHQPERPLRRVCGTLAMGVRGITQLCPRLQTGFAAGCNAASTRRGEASNGNSAVQQELAELALFDALSEVDDRSPMPDTWQRHSGMFDRCAAAPPHAAATTAAAASGQGGVVVNNLHCAGPTGALLLVDQGVAFGGLPSGVPLRGLCLGRGNAVRDAVLALDAGAFRARFGRVVAAVEAELARTLFPPGERRAAAEKHCRAPGGVVERLAARFAAVRRYVASCRPDTPKWYRSVRAMAGGSQRRADDW